jgi:hypothetical protein
MVIGRGFPEKKWVDVSSLVSGGASSGEHAALIEVQASIQNFVTAAPGVSPHG